MKDGTVRKDEAVMKDGAVMDREKREAVLTRLLSGLAQNDRPCQVVLLGDQLPGPAGPAPMADSGLDLIVRSVTGYRAEAGRAATFRKAGGLARRAALLLFLSGLADGLVVGQAAGAEFLLKGAAVAAAAAWGIWHGLRSAVSGTLVRLSDGREPVDGPGVLSVLARGGVLYALDVSGRGGAGLRRWNLVVVAPGPLAAMERLHRECKAGPRAVSLSLQNCREIPGPGNLTALGAERFQVLGPEPERAR
jgi:hypothetical protein